VERKIIVQGATTPERKKHRETKSAEFLRTGKLEGNMGKGIKRGKSAQREDLAIIKKLKGYDRRRW